MPRLISPRVMSVLLLISVFLSSCSGYLLPSPTTFVEVVPATSTPLPPSATFTSTVTTTPTLTSTPTNTLTPSTTPTPSDTPTITPTATNSPYVIPENAIMMYFTILGSGGPVACGDSLYAVYTGHVRTGDTEEDIRIALNSLFSSGQYFGGLYNAVYPNNFRVQSVDFKQSTGKAVIVLKGGYVKPADYCDSRRYREQIWATARRFPEVKNIGISLTNGILLGDLLAAFTDK
ncbi:MAG: hypothetical protein IMY76_08460 [Chloroflexi bacterium]|nr:hypothetical protein [Chloroflexota bacterium]